MLKIKIPESEYFDERIEEFVNFDAVELHLEHSLVSLSKWESFWEIPFLSKETKTREQTLDYIRKMTLNDVPSEAFFRLTQKNFDDINEYIGSKQTATQIFEIKPATEGSSSKVITAELIYYWMVVHNIPFECQEWHLTRLMTLIRVCNAQSGSSEKVSKKDIAEHNRQLNAKRRAELGSRG